MTKRSRSSQTPPWQKLSDGIKQRLSAIGRQRSGSTSSAKSSRSNRTGSKRASSSKQGKSFGEQFKQLRVRIPHWQEVAEGLPPWTDEVAAILLIIFGIVSLLALLDFSPAGTLTSNWADAIRQLFGVGAFVVAAGILGVGVLILLPKAGIVVRLSWQRILAIEIAFISFLALLHLIANDPEPRALARTGQGGGYIGWALSQIIIRLFDPITSTVIYSLIFAVALGRAIGVRRSHLRQGLDWILAHLRRFASALEDQAETLETPPVTAPTIPTLDNTEWAAEATAPLPARPVRPSVVPRGSVEERKPHVRLLTPQAAPTANGGEDSDAGQGQSPFPGERPSIVPRDDTAEYRPLMAVSTAQRKKKVQRDEEGHRYFRAEDIKEARRVGKRKAYLPAYDLLDEHDLNQPSDEELNQNARTIEDTLGEFDIDVEVIDVKIGPTVTQYAVQPFKEVVNEAGEVVLQRVRVGRITALEGDLAMALSARRLRIEAPVPGFSYVGVEVPNRQPSTVSLRGVMESEIFYGNKAPLALPLGRDVSGASFVTDLAKMPHLLVAGTTGSGKSVALASITTALVMNNTPDELRLILLDPKMVELTRFNGLPHLLGPVETEQERIVGVLRWAAREMDRRYKLLEVEAARNIETYNRALGRRRKDEHLPYIVIIFDEIGDLMLSDPDETEKLLTRLAQMARAVGMHLIVATQRPSVDVITGLIKANFPARISFAVASGVDSRVILDTVGAETLIGRGDMLFLASDAAGPQRIQGCYVDDNEIRHLIEHWANWHQEQVTAGKRDARTLAPWERGMTRREILSETDPMLEEAIELVLEAGEASASLMQRKLGVGYPRAARLMDLMHELGIIGAAQAGGRTREVLYKPGDKPFQNIVEKRTRSS